MRYRGVKSAVATDAPNTDADVAAHAERALRGGKCLMV
jgi:hypothetical protein